MDIADYGESNSGKKSVKADSHAGARQSPEVAGNQPDELVDKKDAAASLDHHEKSDVPRGPARLAAELADVGKQWARQCGAGARELSDEYMRLSIGYVQQRPVRAMLIGISVGVALTMWLSRRKTSDS